MVRNHLLSSKWPKTEEDKNYGKNQNVSYNQTVLTSSRTAPHHLLERSLQISEMAAEMIHDIDTILIGFQNKFMIRWQLRGLD